MRAGILRIDIKTLRTEVLSTVVRKGRQIIVKKLIEVSFYIILNLYVHSNSSPDSRQYKMKGSMQATL